MNYELIKARVIAFAYEAGTLITLAILGALASPEFQALVVSHFGEGLTASAILLFVTAIVKHVRNLNVLKKYEERVGGYASYDGPTMI